MQPDRAIRNALLAALACAVAACPGQSPTKSRADSGPGSSPSSDLGSYVPPAADGYVPPASGDLGGSPSSTTGTKTCAEVDACMLACAQGDTACMDACFKQGTADAQAKMTALEQCDNQAVQGTCKTQCATPSSQQCSQCMQAACSAQLTACLGSTTPPTNPSGGGTGNLGCAQILKCYESCQDAACADKCFYQGTAAAQATMSALEACDQQAEQTTCKSQCASYNQSCWNCLDQACAAQLQACMSS
jgi:hypothetical protein